MCRQAVLLSLLPQFSQRTRSFCPVFPLLWCRVLGRGDKDVCAWRGCQELPEPVLCLLLSQGFPLLSGTQVNIPCGTSSSWTKINRMKGEKCKASMCNAKRSWERVCLWQGERRMQPLLRVMLSPQRQQFGAPMAGHVPLAGAIPLSWCQVRFLCLLLCFTSARRADSARGWKGTCLVSNNSISCNK